MKPDAFHSKLSWGGQTISTCTVPHPGDASLATVLMSHSAKMPLTLTRTYKSETRTYTDSPTVM